jgi:hypothetical protein
LVSTSLAAAACAIAFDRSVTSQEGTWKPRQRKHPRSLRPWRTGVGLRPVSGYWESNVVTLTSGDRVQIRAVAPSDARLTPGTRESKAQWYDPGPNTANFIVLFPGLAGYPGFTQERAVLATFGRPGRTYRVGSCTILVWNRNLLRELRE